MNFSEAVLHLAAGEIIKIKGENWCLVMKEDKNLQCQSVYISTNGYAQAWNPQGWQLKSNDWIVI